MWPDIPLEKFMESMVMDPFENPYREVPSAMLNAQQIIDAAIAFYGDEAASWRIPIH